MPASEIITNTDGSIYHLALHPEDVPDVIILVGDQHRVPLVSRHFDSISRKVVKREFVSHLGTFRGHAIGCISSGIGTDNIDIVLNELELLSNYNLQTGEKKLEERSLTFFRLGTSGALQDSIPVDSILLSELAIGLDGLGAFYPFPETPITQQLQTVFGQQSQWEYSAQADNRLLIDFKDFADLQGTTITASGFYAPQGRKVTQARSDSPYERIMNDRKLKAMVTNLEMETAGIYGLAKLFRHRALSVNAILANRVTGEFSQHPQQTIEKMIKDFFDTLSDWIAR